LYAPKTKLSTVTHADYRDPRGQSVDGRPKSANRESLNMESKAATPE